MTTETGKTATRRGHGEGTIFQRKDGRWAAVIDLGWTDGRRVRKTLYGATQKAVADKMKVARREQEQGRDLTAKRETVESFLRRWLTDVVEPRLAPKTVDHHRYLSEKHIIPALGKTALDKLTPADVTRFLNKKRDDGLAVLTVNHMRATLRTALNVAVRWGLVARNVVMATDPVTGDTREIAPLTTAEMAKFLAAIRGDAYECLYRLTLSLGLRIGETLGLHWQDVDLAGEQPWALGRPCLRIEWTAQRGDGHGGQDGADPAATEDPEEPEGTAHPGATDPAAEGAQDGAGCPRAGRAGVDRKRARVHDGDRRRAGTAQRAAGLPCRLR